MVVVEIITSGTVGSEFPGMPNVHNLCTFGTHDFTNKPARSRKNTILPVLGALEYLL